MMFKSCEMRFKIGDIITGVEDTPYPATNSCGTYNVIRLYNDGYIRVKVVEHTKLSIVGNEYDVLPKYFVYAKDFVHWEGIFSGAYDMGTFSVKDGVIVVSNVSKDSPCYKQLCAEYEKYLKNEKEKNDNAVS